MRFGGRIKDRLQLDRAHSLRLPLGKFCGDRGEQCGLISLGAAGRERPVGLTRIVAEAFAERADEQLLHFRRKRRMLPRRKLRIHGRDERVGGDAHRRRRRIEQSEVTRMRNLHVRAAHAVGG